MELWLAFLFVLLASLGYRYMTRRVVGDIEMLQLGGIIYIAVPFIAFGADVFEGYPGIEGWRTLFGPASANSTLLLAFCVCLGIGYIGGQKVKAPAPAYLNRPLHEGTIRLASLFLWAFWALTVRSRTDAIGMGYSTEYDPELLGQLGTVNLVSVILLLNARQFKLAKGLGYWATLLLLGANSLALLSMGGRMYVFAPVIALLLQSLSVTRSRGKPLLIAVVLVAAMLFIGVWRIGADLSTEFFLYIAAGEPIFTSMSLGSFISYNGIPAFAVPYQFMGSVVNFIPSALFPNKIDFIPTIQDGGLNFDSPMGATHMLVSLLGNFGWVGSLVFAALFGWIMGGLRRVDRRGWWFYFYCCALIPFMLYRDGFSIFNKATIFNGLILSSVLLMFDRITRRSHRPARMQADAVQVAALGREPSH